MTAPNAEPTDSSTNSADNSAANSSAETAPPPPSGFGSASQPQWIFGTPAAVPAGGALFGAVPSGTQVTFGAAKPAHLQTRQYAQAFGAPKNSIETEFRWEEPERETSRLLEANKYGQFDKIIADVKDRYKPEGRAALTTDNFAAKIHSSRPAEFSFSLRTPTVYESDECALVGGLRWRLEMARDEGDRLRVHVRCDAPPPPPSSVEGGWSCRASVCLRVHAQTPRGKDLVMLPVNDRALSASKSDASKADASRISWSIPLQTLWNAQHALVLNDTITMSAHISVKDVTGVKSGIDFVANEILAEVLASSSLGGVGANGADELAPGAAREEAELAKLRAETRLLNAQAEAKELEVAEKRRRPYAPYYPSRGVFGSESLLNTDKRKV